VEIFTWKSAENPIMLRRRFARSSLGAKISASRISYRPAELAVEQLTASSNELLTELTTLEGDDPSPGLRLVYLLAGVKFWA
jgi:hypothetical protein